MVWYDNPAFGIYENIVDGDSGFPTFGTAMSKKAVYDNFDKGFCRSCFENLKKYTWVELPSRLKCPGCGIDGAVIEVIQI